MIPIDDDGLTIQESEPLYLLKWHDTQAFEIHTEQSIRTKYKDTALFHRAALTEHRMEWHNNNPSYSRTDPWYDLDEVFEHLTRWDHYEFRSNNPEAERKTIADTWAGMSCARSDVTITRLSGYVAK